MASEELEWANGLRKTGYLLAPIWSRKTGNNTADFAKGYRYMLAKTARSMLRQSTRPADARNNVEFENCRQAAKKNIDAPAAWKACRTSSALGRPMNLLPSSGASSRSSRSSRQSAVKQVANSFFFAVPTADEGVAAATEQILEVLIGIGLIRKKSDLYKSIDGTMLESGASLRRPGSRERQGLDKRSSPTCSPQASILLSNNPTAKQQQVTADKRSSR